MKWGEMRRDEASSQFILRVLMELSPFGACLILLLTLSFYFYAFESVYTFLNIHWISRLTFNHRESLSETMSRLSFSTSILLVVTLICATLCQATIPECSNREIDTVMINEKVRNCASQFRKQLPNKGCTSLQDQSCYCQSPVSGEIAIDSVYLMTYVLPLALCRTLWLPCHDVYSMWKLACKLI